MLLHDSTEKREEVREREWRRGGWGLKLKEAKTKKNMLVLKPDCWQCENKLQHVAVKLNIPQRLLHFP